MPKPWARWRASMSSSTKELRVQEQLEALPRGELPAVVLALHRGRAPGVQCLLAQLREPVETLLDRVRNRGDGRGGATALALNVLLFDGHGSRLRQDAQRLGAKSITSPPPNVARTP